MPVVDELVTILGLKGDPSNAREAGKMKAALGDIRKTALIAGAAVVAAAVAVDQFAKHLAASVDEGGKFADSVGTSYEALQEFEFAIKRVGGQSSEFRGDLQKLTASMSSPIPGEFNRELLLLGVSTRKVGGEIKTADEVLLDLAARFKDFDAVKAQQFGQKLGLSQSTIKLLQKGEAGIAALRKEARDLGGILPEDSKARAAAFNDALTNVRFTLAGIARQAGIAVLPALTEANQTLNDFLQANRQLITSGLETFIKGLTRGVGRFTDMVKRGAGYVGDLLEPFKGINSELDGTEAIATAVSVVLVGLAATAGIIAAKFVLIGAAVAAAVLVVDDIITAFKGGDSITGRWFDKFEKRFPGIVDLLRTVADLVGGTITKAFDLWLKYVEWLGEALSDLGGGWLDLLEKGAKFLGFGDASSPAAGPSSPVAPIASTILNQNRTSTAGDTNIQFHISGAGSPMQVAKEVEDRLGPTRQRAQSLSPGLRAPVAQ